MLLIKVAFCCGAMSLAAFAISWLARLGGRFEGRLVSDLVLTLAPAGEMPVVTQAASSCGATVAAVLASFHQSVVDLKEHHNKHSRDPWILIMNPSVLESLVVQQSPLFIFPSRQFQSFSRPPKCIVFSLWTHSKLLSVGGLWALGVEVRQLQVQHNWHICPLPKCCTRQSPSSPTCTPCHDQV